MLLLLLALLQAGEDSGVPIAERTVLLDLYRATDGENWIDKEGWDGQPGTECSWKGVRCWPATDASQRWHVNVLELSKNGLKGPLPSSLATLPYLIKLDVTGNGISLPVPEPVLRLWDQGRLDIECGGAFTDADEVRLTVLTNVYCANETIVVRSDGKVSYFRERCKTPRAKNPRPYCELRQAETREFHRLTRYLSANGFFELHDRPINKGVWVDVPTVTVTVKGRTGIRAVEIFPNGDDSLQTWSYEKVVRGIVADLTWGAPLRVAQCPFP